MIDQIETTNNIDAMPTATLRLDAIEPMEQTGNPPSTTPAIGRMELAPSHRAILFSVKVYLILIGGLFGYHFWTLLKI